MFSLIARKRASGLRWRGPDGETITRQTIAHCREEGRVWWQTTTGEAGAAPAGGKARQGTMDDLVELVPQSGSISTAGLQEAAHGAGINEKRFRHLRTLAVEGGKLFEWKVPRPNARPAIHIARHQQPEAGQKEEPAVASSSYQKELLEGFFPVPGTGSGSRFGCVRLVELSPPL